MRDNTKAALELAALGWQMMPLHTPKGKLCDCGKADCISPAKHPRTRHGLTDATSSFEQVATWFGQWPYANVGVATGPPSGIVALDVDPRHEGDVEWTRLVTEHGYAHDGPIAVTGGGGWHYLFKHPGTRVPSRSGDIAPGLDVRGDGGYIVAAPSVHVSGMSYEWLPGYEPWDVAPPPIPAWLLALMTRVSETGKGAEPVPDIIREGQRRTRLLSLAGSMRNRNMGEQAIRNALMAENAEKCVPPMEITEIAKLAAEAASFPPGEAVIIPSASGKRSSADAVRREKYVPHPFSAADLEHEEIPEARWAVAGLIPEGLTVFGGKAKLGKSFKMLNIGIAVAEGGIALGEIPVEDGDVLMLSLEDNKRRLKSRMKKMCAPGWPERLQLEIRWPRTDEGGMEALDAWLGQHPLARLVVVDTLAKFKPRPHGGKRGDIYAEDYDFGVALQELALKHGVALVAVTHLNKTMHEDWVDTFQGSAGVAGSADTLMNLTRPRGKAGQEKDARLRITGRDIDEQDLAVHFDNKTGRWTVLGDAEDSRKGTETSELLRIMAKAGSPVSPDDVAAYMEKTRGAAQRLLQRAAFEGFIVSHKGKLFTLPNLNDDIPTSVSSLSSMSSLSSVSPDTPPTALSSSSFGASHTSENDDNDNNDNSDTDDNKNTVSFNLASDPTPHTSENDDNDNNDNSDTDDNKNTVSFTNRTRPRPAQPCHACKRDAWTDRGGGRWVCETCHPTPEPDDGRGRRDADDVRRPR